MSPSKSTTISHELLQNASLFTLTRRSWGNRRKVDVSQINTVDEEAKKKLLSVSKRLVDSQFYDAIQKHLNEVRSWVLARCVYSYVQKGVYLVSTKMVDEVEQYVDFQNNKLNSELVPNLLHVYDGLKEKAKRELGSLYSEDDYPSKERLRDMFSIEYQWLTFGIPDNLPKKVREREAKKLQKKFEEAQDEIIAALRVSFGQMVEHMVTRLTPKDGKVPIIRDSVVDNFQDFFNTFAFRNIVNDDELEAVVNKAREALNGVTGKKLRNYGSVRAKTLNQFQQLKGAVDQLVADRPSRRFSFDEEE